MNTEQTTPMTPEEEFMAFVGLLPTPQWRLLRKGEKFQPGDQFFNLHPDCLYWDFIPSAWEGTDCSGDDLERRQMTPAEVNAEELKEALVQLLDLDKNVVGDSARRTPILAKIRAIIDKVTA